MIRWRKQCAGPCHMTNAFTTALRRWRGERKEHPETYVDSGDSNEHMLEVTAAAYANEGERQLNGDARNRFGSVARTQNPAQ